ncbi:hypothetical protein [Nonomuraea salmonea]|uniref:hypothetical protein n=1 Tax=Nonomuraea salmonea TaxID=46181 RepID=UPI0031ECFB26
MAVKPQRSPGGILAVATTRPPAPEARQIIAGLAELTVVQLAHRVARTEPHALTDPPVTAVEDLADTYATTLTSLLGVLKIAAARRRRRPARGDRTGRARAARDQGRRRA